MSKVAFLGSCAIIKTLSVQSEFSTEGFSKSPRLNRVEREERPAGKKKASPQRSNDSRLQKRTG